MKRTTISEIIISSPLDIKSIETAKNAGRFMDMAEGLDWLNDIHTGLIKSKLSDYLYRQQGITTFTRSGVEHKLIKFGIKSKDNRRGLPVDILKILYQTCNSNDIITLSNIPDWIISTYLQYEAVKVFNKLECKEAIVANRKPKKKRLELRVPITWLTLYVNNKYPDTTIEGWVDQECSHRCTNKGYLDLPQDGKYLCAELDCLCWETKSYNQSRGNEYCLKPCRHENCSEPFGYICKCSKLHEPPCI